VVWPLTAAIWLAEAPGLSKTATHGLAQAVRGQAKRQASGAADVAEPICESTGRKGLACRCHQERHILGRVRGQNFLQLWTNPEFQGRAGLLLAHPNYSIINMLAAHADDVAAALAGKECQGEGQPLP
jgi:hypothetical protein